MYQYLYQVIILLFVALVVASFPNHPLNALKENLSRPKSSSQENGGENVGQVERVFFLKEIYKNWRYKWFSHVLTVTSYVF